jgi:spermidine/putrescine transport system permease protein
MAAVLIFFYVPIFTLIAFSFQEGRFLTLPFEGVSLKWYGELFRSGPALTALQNSTIIAVFTMIFATAIGTMAAIVAVRYRFRGKLAFQALAGAPLAFPQLLLGIVLLLWFSVLGRWFDFNTGLVTAIIGHIVYIAPFAMVYRHVTIPLLWPGIFSAAIFAFLLSWGNFYITYSLAGSTRTVPTFIFSGIAVGSSPLYPAIATVVFVPGILLVILANRFRLRAQRANPA